MSHPSSGSGIGNNYVIKTRGSRDDDTKERKRKQKSQNSNRRNSIYGLQRYTPVSLCTCLIPFFCSTPCRCDELRRLGRSSRRLYSLSQDFDESTMSLRWNVRHFKRWKMIFQVALMLRGLMLFFLLTLSTWKTVQHHWKLDNSERNFCETRN